MRFALDAAVCSDAENRVSPTPIAAVIGKIVIYHQIGPTGRECRPIRQRPTAFEQGLHMLGGNECESVVFQDRL
jgi:hypothetical protein